MNDPGEVSIKAKPTASKRIVERLKRHGEANWVMKNASDVMNGKESFLVTKNKGAYAAWFAYDEVTIYDRK